MRNYAGVLRKPFTPQMLQGLVDGLMKNTDPEVTREHTLTEDKLHQKFHSNFSDENKLVEETLSMTNKKDTFSPLGGAENEFGDWSSASVTSPPVKPDVTFPAAKPAPKVAAAPAPAPAPAAPVEDSNLWGAPEQSGNANDLMSPSDSFAYKAALENKVAENISGLDLNKVVEKALEKLLPPLVEKLVQERLDRLMKENENFLELNP